MSYLIPFGMFAMACGFMIWLGMRAKRRHRIQRSLDALNAPTLIQLSLEEWKQVIEEEAGMTDRSYNEVKIEQYDQWLKERDQLIQELREEIERWRAENARLKSELLGD